MILGFRAQSGYIHTGPLTIGRDAFVGVGSTLDIDTRIGDGAQLGHSSSLHRGQSIPDGERCMDRRRCRPRRTIAKCAMSSLPRSGASSMKPFS